MKKYIYIFISFLFITSCKLHEKNDTSDDYDFSDIKDYDTTGKSDNDLTHLQDSVYRYDKIKINKLNLLVGSNHYNNYPIEVLKIVEVQNTKVINNKTNLSEGRIVYKIPSVMKVRSTYKVLVRISKSKATISIYDSLQGTVMTSRIPITETMEVKLVDVSPKDNKAFEIIDGNSGIQIIESGETYTEWNWDVTPVKIGNSRLKIVVSIIRDGNKKDIVYEDTVDVEMDAKEQILFFLKKYWQVLLTSIAIPFIVFIYKKRKEKNQSDGKSKIV